MLAVTASCNSSRQRRTRASSSRRSCVTDSSNATVCARCNSSCSNSSATSVGASFSRPSKPRRRPVEGVGDRALSPSSSERRRTAPASPARCSPSGRLATSKLACRCRSLTPMSAPTASKAAPPLSRRLGGVKSARQSVVARPVGDAALAVKPLLAPSRLDESSHLDSSTAGCVGETATGSATVHAVVGGGVLAEPGLEGGAATKWRRPRRGCDTKADVVDAEVPDTEAPAGERSTPPGKVTVVIGRPNTVSAAPTTCP
mmetsp:Transcript_104671/g.301267  ORF Transcript_104671/g.301267 Transcript_104671/m.301267 type:complete len:259 (+) Transcript_104671:1178-1954(+)